MYGIPAARKIGSFEEKNLEFRSATIGIAPALPARGQLRQPARLFTTGSGCGYPISQGHGLDGIGKIQKKPCRGTHSRKKRGRTCLCKCLCNEIFPSGKGEYSPLHWPVAVRPGAVFAPASGYSWQSRRRWEIRIAQKLGPHIVQYSPPS